jgi:hypothetical protein
MANSFNSLNAQSVWTRLFRGLFALLVVGLNITPGWAQPTIPEYKLKAVFLFRFTEYIDWPASAFDGDDRPFVIGIFGTDPFGEFLDETVQNEKVKGCPVKVRRFRSLDEITSCHMLYVSSSAVGQISAILEKVKHRPILTVSDNPNFARRGGMICFVRNGTHVGFRINANAAKEAGLTISAKLLQIAEVVSTTK